MANISQDTPLRFKGEVKTENFILDTLAAQIVYRGVGLVIDQNVDAEYAHIANLALVSGDVFLGIAAHGKSVQAGDPERAESAGVEVIVEPSIVGFKMSNYGTFTNTNVGTVICMSDTGTLTATPGAYPRIGKIFKIEDGYVFVQLETPWVMTV